MKVSIITLFALLVGSALLQFVSALPTAASKFGNVFISKEGVSSDAKAIIYDASESMIRSTNLPTSIPAVNLADVTARALGVQPINAAFDASTIFVDAAPTKAALTFALPSVGSSDVLASAKGFSVDITSEIFSSPLSLLNTAVRGQEARFHGITGCKVGEVNHKTQNIEIVDAFSTDASFPKRPAVADVLAGSFNGQSLVVSASANPKFAMSSSASPRLLMNKNWNVASVAVGTGFTKASSQKFSEESNSILSNTLRTKTVEVESIEALANGVSVVNGNVVINGVSIAQSDAGVQDLIAELVYAKNIAAQLTQSLSSFVSDNAPDAFTFTLSGLKSLSVENRAVFLPVVDTVIADVIAAFAAAYDNKIVATTILLGSPVVFSENDKNIAISTLKQAAIDLQTVKKTSPPAGKLGMANPFVQDVKMITEAFPLVFVSPMTHVCNRANVDSQESKAGVVYSCSERIERDGFVSGVFLETTAPTVITSDDIRKYQIVLWVVLGLVAVVYYAVYSTAGMTIIQDPALFGNLSPTWTKRR